MAEEKIGGLAIEIVTDQSRLESELNQIRERIRQFEQEVKATLRVSVQGSVRGAGGGQAPAVAPTAAPPPEASVFRAPRFTAPTRPQEIRIAFGPGERGVRLSEMPRHLAERVLKQEDFLKQYVESIAEAQALEAEAAAKANQLAEEAYRKALAKRGLIDESAQRATSATRTSARRQVEAAASMQQVIEATSTAAQHQEQVVAQMQEASQAAQQVAQQQAAAAQQQAQLVSVAGTVDIGPLREAIEKFAEKLNELTSLLQHAAAQAGSAEERAAQAVERQAATFGVAQQQVATTEGQPARRPRRRRTAPAPEPTPEDIARQNLEASFRRTFSIAFLGIDPEAEARRNREREQLEAAIRWVQSQQTESMYVGYTQEMREQAARLGVELPPLRQSATGAGAQAAPGIGGGGAAGGAGVPPTGGVGVPPTGGGGVPPTGGGGGGILGGGGGGGGGTTSGGAGGGAPLSVDLRMAATMERQLRQQQQAGLRADIERARIAAAMEAREAAILASATTAARTPRTLASALGGIFFGSKEREIELETRLAQARMNVASATRYQMVFERQMIENQVRIERLTQEADAYRMRGNERRARAREIEAQALADWNAEIEASKEYKDAVDKTTQAIEEQAAAARELQSFGTAAATAIRGLAAVTIAGAAFGLGLTAIKAVGQALIPVIADIADRLTGYQTLTNRVTQALGEQTRAMQGNAQAAIATAAAQAGVSGATSDYLQQVLELNVRAKAASQVMGELSNLFRSTQGQIQGITGGFGGLFGTAFLAQQLGGGKGVTEQIAGDLAVLAKGFRGVGNLPSGTTVVPITPGSRIDQTGVQRLQQEIARAQIQPGEAIPSEAMTQYIETLNEALQRGADVLGDAARVSLEFSDNAEDVRRSAEVAAQADDSYMKEAMRTYGLVLKVNGQVVKNAQQYRELFQQFLVYGLSTPDVGTMLRAQRGQINATRFLQQMSLQLAQQQIGRGFGMQVGLGPQFLGDRAAPLRALGVQNVQPVVDLYRSIREEADAALASSVQFVRQVLTDMPSAADDYAQALNRARSYASQIAELDVGIQTKQTALAAAQYAYNLYITRRNLADAQGLAGQLTSANKDNLGVIERQNWLLGRQLQMLGFELTQRQINFRRALAGFQVPGLTPEEQAARVEQAQIEAEFAQKQLDLQRQIFALQGRGFQISATRQVIDLTKQLALLQQGWQLQLDTAEAQAKIAALGALLSREQTKADAIYSTAIDRIQTIYRMAADQISRFANSTMQTMLQFANTVARSWGVALNGMSPFLSFGGGGGQPPKMRQHGALLATKGPTLLPGGNIAGEAGTEFVAILRNPRPFSGGSSVIVNVTINGTTNLTRDQLEAWARQVGDIVESRIAQRGAMMGFRTP